MDTSSYNVILYAGNQLPKQYENMIFSKWLRSLRYGNEYYKLIDSDSYFTAYHKYIETVLSRPETIIRLAVLANDPDVVLGFSVCRYYLDLNYQVLDFVHVQKDMRKQGIGKSLVPEDINILTHLTKIGMSLWSTHLPNAIFNPFI